LIIGFFFLDSFELINSAAVETGKNKINVIH
jgi:hypothetical protein